MHVKTLNNGHQERCSDEADPFVVEKGESFGALLLYNADRNAQCKQESGKCCTDVLKVSSHINHSYIPLILYFFFSPVRKVTPSI